MSDDTTAVKQRRINYGVTFNSEAGQKVLQDLRDRFHINGSTVVVDKNGNLDPLRLALREGERNVVLWILSELQKAGVKNG